MKYETTKESERAILRRVVWASLAGTVLEWYDFFLYGFTAALVFGKLFFPTYSPLVATLASFATLAIGFVARPVGGILFGHFGDRIGRKATLIVTLSVMGGATFLMGLLPTYDTIGIAAPVLLVVLRCLQGIGLGGEWGGAVLMTLEHAPTARRGLYGSLVQLGAGSGLSLATLVLLTGSVLPGNAFLDWAWRIPFLASIVLLGVGLYIRARITETPEFKKVREKELVVRLPISDVVRKYPKQVLATFGLYLGAITVPFYTVWVFLVYYATAQLHLDRSAVLLGVVVTNIILLSATVAGGVISDRLGRRSACLAGALIQALVAFPLFWIVDLAEPRWVGFGMLMFGAPLWFLWGVMAAFIAEQFPAEVRYTGMSIGSQAATIIGGLVPFFATAMFPIAGTWPVSALVVVCSLLTMLSAIFTSEGVRRRVGVQFNTVMG
jgi:MFS transporter, MHS family, shikimate and dehydroshikimate transport protein